VADEAGEEGEAGSAPRYAMVTAAGGGGESPYQVVAASLAVVGFGGFVGGWLVADRRRLRPAVDGGGGR
jgi:hypothetical protein